MEKKTYIQPCVKIVTVMAVQMMAASPNGIEVINNPDVKGNQQLGNERRGEWGDLWQ